MTMDMDVLAVPKDWLEASYEISRHLQKSRKQHSRWEILNIQKWIGFLRDPNQGGIWYGIEQRRQMVYGRFFGYRSPLTCNLPSVNPAADYPSLEDLRRLEIEEKVFLAENDIERMNAREMKVGRRKLIIPHPIYNGPLEEVQPEEPCRCYFASKGVMYRRHLKMGHDSLRIDPPYKPLEVRIHPNVRREDLLESWKTIKGFKGSGPAPTGQKREAPALARNMRWARMYATGKSLSQIVALELRTKAGYSWRSRYPSSTESKLKKVIREALRKQGVLGKSPSRAKPVK